MKTVRPSSAFLTRIQQQTIPSAYRAAPASRVHSKPQTRPFSNLFTPSTQSLTATRTLPYSSSTIYAVISDIASYSSFIPYCHSSTVTKHSSPDKDGNVWPEEAALVVGWENISEKFTSRVYCVPGKIVEAVSGQTQTTLRGDDIAHHSPSSSPASSSEESNSPILTHLLTRWTLRQFPYKPGPISADAHPLDAESPLPPRDQTDVNLAIEYQFANPVYAAMSAAVAPKVAGLMIEAFEKRVRAIVEGPSAGLGGTSGRVGKSEGVLRGRGESP
ncbi:Coenzyme Q-binding protein coq10, mitochondrial [Elasticomyces elasticus]|nr:Coenzyme Q-binding protein coq10, mitochondrial [Elasticomyces elasticus]